MAAPSVAGEVALLRGNDPALSVSQVMGYVQGTTAPYATPVLDSGRGRISPLAAVTALASHQRLAPRVVGVDPVVVLSSGAVPRRV